MPTVVIEQVISLTEGERGEYQVEPMPHHSCRVVIELKLEGSNDWNVMSGADVSGASVTSPSNIGEFHQTGHSFGKLALQANGGNANGTIRATIICEDSDLTADDYSIVPTTTPIPTASGSMPLDWSDLLVGGWIRFGKKIWEKFDEWYNSLTLSIFIGLVFWLTIFGPIYLLWRFFEWLWKVIVEFLSSFQK